MGQWRAYKAVPTNPELPSGSKKLVPDENEMPKLKRIFELYLELKSVQALMYHLQDKGIVTRNNKSFTSGNLYSILKRKIYIGKIEHKGQVYDGIHETIIDTNIFNQVQELLASNCNSHKRRYRSDQPSLLASKLYDDNAFIMSPSHAVKNGKRYRYYISQAYLQKKKELSGGLPQVPANELEEHSLQLIKSKIAEILKLENYSIEQYKLYKQNLENYLENWNLQNKEIHLIVRSIIYKVVISHINIIYYLNPESLEDIFNLIVTKQEIKNYESKEITENKYEIIIQPCELKRVNQGKVLMIGGNKNTTKNKGLIELLKKAWEWSGCIENNCTVEEIAKQEKVDVSYIRKVLKMRFLSPRIQRMILLGENVEKLTSHNLRKVRSMDFKEQEKQLGI